MATLSVVATPIGNLEDITLRALRVLKEADIILCEDTRVTRKLLSHFDIHTKCESYHSQSKLQKVDQIKKYIQEGKNLALVCDAGTPTISDPGSLLVSELRKDFPELSIVAVPGASALTSALSISGMPASEFLFLGFLPHKKGREKLFSEIAESKRTIVFYESPHRIIKTLEKLAEILPKRKVTLARELTKVHEEVYSGTSEEVLTHLQENTEKIRGEFVALISGKGKNIETEGFLR